MKTYIPLIVPCFSWGGYEYGYECSIGLTYAALSFLRPFLTGFLIILKQCLRGSTILLRKGPLKGFYPFNVKAFLRGVTSLIPMYLIRPAVRALFSA